MAAKETVKLKMTFEHYYEEYYRQVFVYAYKKISNLHEAEDLAQDAFVSAYEKFENFDPEKASFQTWIFIIIGNKIKNYYRDKKSYIDIDDPEQYIEPYEESFENEMLEAEYLTEMRAYLSEALEELNSIQKNIVIASYFKNKTSKEIAADLGMTDVNVRVQLSRAIKKMKNYFDKNNIIWEL